MFAEKKLGLGSHAEQENRQMFEQLPILWVRRGAGETIQCDLQ